MSSVGLDVGGTYLKAAWLEDDFLEVKRLPIPNFINIRGRAREIDPNLLKHAITKLLDDVIGSRSCDRILITGQMAGLAFIDETGRAIRPIISWQDTRFDALDRVRDELTAEDLDRLGDGLRVGLPLVTLSEYKRPNASFITSLIGFAAAALSESFPALMHVTDAASFGMLDVQNGTWSDAALAFTQLDRSQLPQPTDSVDAVGVAPRYGSAVCTPVGDQQAALLGAGIKTGHVSMNVATGCQVSMVSSSVESPTQLRPFFNSQYLHTVTHLPAGRLLAAALLQDLGRPPNEEDWAKALGDETREFPASDSALHEIADSCVAAASHFSELESVLFSGGIAVRSRKFRRFIHQLLPLPQETYVGNDASIAGLRELDRGF